MVPKFLTAALMCLIMVTSVTSYNIAPAGASSIGPTDASRDAEPINKADDAPDQPRLSGGGGRSQSCTYWVTYEGLYPVQHSECTEPTDKKSCDYWMAGPGFC